MRTSLFGERSHRAGLRQAVGALCALSLLVGCQSVTGGVEQFYDSKLTLDHPIDWWHQLQGGPVAAERPPPPGITDPYPNFARIPARPGPVDFASKRALVAQFTADRNQTMRLNQQNPITFASPNAAPQTQPKPTTAAKPGAPAVSPPPDTSQLSFDAATPAPGAAPPLPPPPLNDPHPPPALTPVVSGPIPAIPQAAPPLPQLPGLPTSEPIPAIPRPIPTAQISFAQGSAALPDGAETALKALVARRAGARIGVVAGGEARSPSPASQREALPLALQRAGAITAALLAAGVPPADIRAEATAQGRDASARLLN